MAKKERPINPDLNPIYDPWTALDYKAAVTQRFGRMVSLAPEWVGAHRRRLSAYNVLRAFTANAARRLLPGFDESAEKRRQDRREYGDVDAFVAQIRAALLGETQEIVVPGAEQFDPTDEDPPAGNEEDPSGGAPPEPEDPAVVEREAARQREISQAAELQDWLREWAELERLPLKMIETENNAVGLGDGVFSLGWRPDKSRVKIRCWDPAFYFPVLEDGMSEDDYPSRVHIAWEIPAEDDETKTTIRRITWQLGPIMAEGEISDAVIEEWRRTGLLPDGAIQRQFEWDDEPSDLTCYMSDATWTLDTGKARSVEDLTPDDAKFQTDEDGEIRLRDLEIDFVPVVHMPNTVALLDHFGKASLSTVLQLFDDIAAADTDLQAASASTGYPVVGVFGATIQTDSGKISWRPGQVFQGGKEGRMDVMDTSGALTGLIDYVKHLLERASVNAKLPSEVLGRMEKGEVSSGIELRLRFGPLERMVGEMRLVRNEKYALILKFVWRIAIAGGQDDVPKVFLGGAGIELGSFLPSDAKAIVDQVSSLRTAKIISLETAVALLVAAGIIDTDVFEEVASIEGRDFEGALQILEITGDENAAREYLGMDPVVQPVPTAPPVIAPPGGPPGTPPVNPTAQPGTPPAAPATPLPTPPQA